ncbi:hypothetical protein NG796_24160 [Laspinema sp. A4]|uniref:hypothetical protein n=1 Tax=Laspinema sp. D2d TaxID=2953686 RepID=UPI0021BB5811|nr:hypothetical protein [Laspinema sp. D2d]MCT7986369.1 hypothetical protein [Laspinema sp. D2d]
MKFGSIVPVGTDVTPGDWELIKNSSGELRKAFGIAALTAFLMKPPEETWVSEVWLNLAVEGEGPLNGLLILEGLATAGKTDDRSPEVSPKIAPASQNWGSWVRHRAILPPQIRSPLSSLFIPQLSKLAVLLETDRLSFWTNPNFPPNSSPATPTTPLTVPDLKCPDIPAN